MVRVWARAADNGNAVQVAVSDDGRGDPAARRPEAGPETGAPRAAVSVGDAHKAAVLGALLRSEGFEVCAGDGRPPEHAGLWVTDMAGNSLGAARRYLQRRRRNEGCA